MCSGSPSRAGAISHATPRRFSRWRPPPTTGRSWIARSPIDCFRCPLRRHGREAPVGWSGGGAMRKFGWIARSMRSTSARISSSTLSPTCWSQVHWSSRLICRERLRRSRASAHLSVTRSTCWLNWGRARPQMDWDGPTPTIELTTGRILPMYADRLSGALALQLAYAVASSEGVATCFACGRFLYTGSTAGRRATIVLSGLRGARGMTHVEARDAWQVQAEAGGTIGARRDNEQTNERT